MLENCTQSEGKRLNRAFPMFKPLHKRGQSTANVLLIEPGFLNVVVFQGSFGLDDQEGPIRWEYSREFLQSREPQLVYFP